MVKNEIKTKIVVRRRKSKGRSNADIQGTGPTHHPSPLIIQILHDVFQPSIFLESLIESIKSPSRARVLDRIVAVAGLGTRLDILFEQEPGEESEGEFARVRGGVVQVYRVDHLRGRDVDVCKERKEDR